MIIESLMIFLTTLMSLNAPVDQVKSKISIEKVHQQQVNTSVNIRGGWDHN